ncbi:glycosyl hydrolase family 61-domain-containing protein [Lasiosphaeria miniovina]|uniref:lytic cellulose monooxygenase (C4-dehydrogenating) n=1 Tax=Lasiosphaeria miniovina TaxID=1954250 RepID=A0AA40DP15_9PEZI|nr:glycosyl hydrolase family 61-domain-containing protein [Lasiosphaeria miniovina]KAK0706908.1 glycosyl hydrolase family 61-domain-containing protein [Lasiosphaeria miniovina]
MSCHGRATNSILTYQGYNPSYQWSRPPPTVVGWSTPDDLQNTFVSPTAYASPDIVCHLGATPAGAAAPVNAGDTIEIQWTPWPASHKGPVIDYLANCNGPCQNVDKTKLKFFKIDEVGLVDAASGTFGASQLTNNNNSWVVRIPTDIAPGNYVLRHEIIALHAAGQTNGAQNYPFCFSLAISGSGTANPAGIPATQFYAANNPGIKFDLFSKFTSYQIPGPPLYSGALSVAQSKAGPIKATASGVAGLANKNVVLRPTSPAAKVVAAAPSPATTVAAKYAAAQTLVKKASKRTDAPRGA